jgi:hypothetical protein
MSAKYKVWKPKQWQSWYDTLIELQMNGRTMEECAKLFNKHRGTLSRIVNSEMYQKKYNSIIDEKKKKYLDATDMLNKNKISVFSQILELIYNAEKDSTKASLAMWFMERFPEFSSKGESTIQTNVYQSSPEQLDKQEKIADNLLNIQRILARGNPNVIKVDSKQDEDDFPRETAEDTGGDTEDTG